MKKLSNTEAELEKSIAYKKACITDRSSRSQVFCKNVALKNFAKFTGNICAISVPTNLSKKRLRYKCLLVNFTKFPWAAFL